MAELVYETERVSLWCGDAAEVLPSLKTESFDLVLTDPPYGVEFVSDMRSKETRFKEIRGDESGEEARVPIVGVLEQCVRLVGQNRHLYVFFPEEVLRANDLKVSSPAELIWQKGLGPSMGDLTSPWGRNEERIWFYTSLFRHAGKRGKENNPVRLRKGTILTFPKPTGKSVRHPTEKPISLLQEFIESSSRQGDVVLDPYAGTGSTGVASILTGRRAVLCEIDEKYAEMAKARLVEAERIYNESRRL